MKSSDNRDHLKESAKLLPLLPGVYRFLNREESVIYVGKAKNLRNRVSQYFQSNENLSPKTRVMVAKIESIEHTVVESESEALLLENTLIKRYQPRYNVMLKDSKTYPWICIKKEPYPRVFITRRLLKDGSYFFGPYSNVSHAYSLIDIIDNLFKIRNCKLSLTQENIKLKKFRPCLRFHIGKCKAPCVGFQSEESYNLQIEKIKLILKGETSLLAEEIKEEMKIASSQLRFEDAQEAKERLETLNRHYSKSLVVSQSITDVDVFTLVFENNMAFGNWLRVVNGSIIQSLNVELKLPIDENREVVLARFIITIGERFAPLSDEIITEYIPEGDFSPSKIHIPRRGEKLNLLELSIKNARIFKIEKIKQEQILRPDEHRDRVLETIKKDLNLVDTPSHIECFDNSNIQGKYAVSACVVFKNATPSKRDYRHFNVKRVVGADDFGTMKEVINRRYSRIVEEGNSLPQLIVIDGGRGQVNAAYEALEELGLEKKIRLVGIAKRLEELITPGDPHPLFLDKNSSTLRVMMQLRDEAHRFGITHHRKRRSKGQIESELSEIKGIGEKSLQKLLTHFKSLLNLRSAPTEEIRKVAGARIANILKEYFDSESAL
ncbi:MAG: excinuclease ABC subunit UvrC [Bacteroidales bacterium]|jgi:excinuclease ABC subunit C|nr:excinuclease ABC subunit UvrC [Bacteroidales bacterium]MDD3273008.1 excinuclease ABC subunit UvrC [Bacteroidales bacterium]MDD4057670.1 excinuclease ABC subunit UvrC [Bacteroidales bacterium]